MDSESQWPLSLLFKYENSSPAKTLNLLPAIYSATSLSYDKLGLHAFLQRASRNGTQTFLTPSLATLIQHWQNTWTSLHYARWKWFLQMFSCKHDIGAFYNPMTSSKTLHPFPVNWGKSWRSELLSLAIQLGQIFTVKKKKSIGGLVSSVLLSSINYA